MKVELQAGDSIVIPEGCKPVIKDGNIVFEKEVSDFKDGDIVISDIGTICIFKENSTYDRFTSYYNTVHSDNKNWNKRAFHHATEEEKQLLFNKLKTQGLRWNSEEKQIEHIRWKVGAGESYYFITTTGTVSKSISLDGYTFLNQFRTEEQAEEAARRIKEVLHDFHEEIGE